MVGGWNGKLMMIVLMLVHSFDHDRLEDEDDVFNNLQGWLVRSQKKERENDKDNLQGWLVSW